MPELETTNGLSSCSPSRSNADLSLVAALLQAKPCTVFPAMVEGAVKVPGDAFLYCQSLQVHFAFVPTLGHYWAISPGPVSLATSGRPQLTSSLGFRV